MTAHEWSPTTATGAVFRCQRCGAIGFSPHPLPTEGCAADLDADVPLKPGWYLTGHSGLLILDTDGTWRGTLSNARIIHEEELPSDLLHVEINPCA